MTSLAKGGDDMSDHIHMTETHREGGSGLWLTLGLIIGALIVLFLLWAFWLQPAYFPQVQVLTIPQQVQPTPVQPTPVQPAPPVNVQGGQGGTGGTGGTGTGGTGTGGTGTGGSQTTTP